MITSNSIKEIYRQIQSLLFYLIPEKWDRIFLYASMKEKVNNITIGEMFFYYFPTGVLKKNPVNVYEIPEKFNIEEQVFNRYVDKLYELIKKLREKRIEEQLQSFTNITISVQNFKFKVEYSYFDLTKSKFTNEQRHVIWKYKYINNQINTYTRKEKKLIYDFLQSQEYSEMDSNEEYIEGIYSTPSENINEYRKVELYQREQDMVQDDFYNNQILRPKK